MTLDELKTRILKFRDDLDGYYKELKNGENILELFNPEYRDEIDERRNSLNSEFGSLKRYIEHFGINIPDNHYEGSEQYVRVLSESKIIYLSENFKYVIQDLGIMYGRLNDLSEDEFQQITKSSDIVDEYKRSSLRWWCESAIRFWQRRKILTKVLTILMSIAVLLFSTDFLGIRTSIEIIVKDWF